MFELYHQIFQQFFVQDKSSLIVAELIESRRFLDPIREYFIINKMDLHEQSVKTISNFLTIIL